MLRTLFKSELQQQWIHRSQWVQLCMYQFMLLCIVPFAIGTNSAVLEQISIAMIWLMLFISSIFSTRTIFESEYHNGSLLQKYIHPFSMLHIVLVKYLTQTLIMTLIVFVIIALTLLLYTQNLSQLMPYSLVALVGMLSINLINMTISAITASLHRASGLNLLLLFPLFIPVLIFGASAMSQYQTGNVDEAMQPLLFLVGYYLVMAPILLGVMCKVLIVVLNDN